MTRRASDSDSSRRRLSGFKANRKNRILGYTDAETSLRMSRIGQRDTAPERRVAQIVRCLGHRYRLQNRDLPGSPDLANRSQKWAIYVHGCFWHSHGGCTRATIPARNRKYWLEKFAANRARDARVSRRMRRMGYTVLVVWECEVDRHLAKVEARIFRLLDQIRGNRDS